MARMDKRFIHGEQGEVWRPDYGGMIVTMLEQNRYAEYAVAVVCGAC